ncbi:MAG: PTS transporter subunit EIIB [Malacoplasma sp.]|nr:PTS transporter subunit EIIB [Malacoplasma sp.]
MKKTTWYYILTFGIGYLIAKRKAKKIATNVNTELTVSEKIPFEVNEIIEAIGGLENYISNTASLNSIKFNVKNIELVDKERIKKMGAKGVMMSDETVTCLFGDYSKKLSTLINDSNLV